MIEPQQAANSDSLLGSVVSAVSLATFGRTRVSTEALSLGSRKYARALAKTNATISDAREAVTDQFLLTIVMLGVYEHAVSNYNRNFLLIESFRHQNGAIALLKLRKSVYQLITTLDKIVRNLVVKQAVLHAIALPEWIQDGASFGETGVNLSLDECLVQLALLRNSSQSLWRSKDSMASNQCKNEATSLVKHARTVDNLLIRWASNFPPDWTFITQGEPSSGSDVVPSIEAEQLERLQYGSTISLYPNFEQATRWNQYRASRMITNAIIVRALRLIAKCSTEDNSSPKLLFSQQIAAQEEVQEGVDQICASVPYYFDVMGTNSENPRTTKPRLDNVNARQAYLLAWPLTIAVAAPAIPEQQRQWIRSKVLLVSRITGNGALELVANMNTSIQPQANQ